MKLILVCLLYLSCFNVAQGQNQDSSYALGDFHYLMDSTDNKIWIGCGWGGQTSSNMFCLRRLIWRNRYDLIAQLLNSKTASTRYLAAMTFMAAEYKKKHKMDSGIRRTIDSLKTNDEELIPYCGGCTVHFSFTCNSIRPVLPRRKRRSLNYTESWILNCYSKGRDWD